MKSKPCTLIGFYKDRDSDDLINFTESKPAREIESGIFEFDMNVMVINSDGSEHEETETWYVVPLPSDNPFPI